MAKLSKRIRNKEPKNPTKKVEDIKIGDTVIVNDLQFQVCQIDNLGDKICLVDKYACDYYIQKEKNIEVISSL